MSEWPALPLADWQATYDTLHMWTQIVGKVRMALTPHVNHWWEVPLYVSVRGLTTGPIPCPDGAFEMEFDFIRHALDIRKLGADEKIIALAPRTVRDFYHEVLGTLHELGIAVKIWPHPVEVANPIPFADDDTHASYDPESVERFHQVLLHADAALKAFRGHFLGKASPVHFFWGSFDLALTFFSGRRAPERPGADAITKEAYSHECGSMGFWPGAGISGPAFYAYMAPEPAGYASAAVRPEAAFYHPELHEFIFMYDDARNASDPQAALLDFFRSTFEAGATLGGWDRAALERA